MKTLRDHINRIVVAASLSLLAAWSADADAAQLTLTWADNSAGEAGFSIERSVDAAAAFVEVAEAGPETTAFADPGLLDGTTYCYRMRAYTVEAWSDYSEVACGTTASATAALAVVKGGAGSGTVASTPAGIACGSTCSASFTLGTQVTLTTSPSEGSVFTGWSGGGCSGTSACLVTLAADTNVTATFDTAPAAPLPISFSGLGQGTVISSPAGIDCSAACSASFPRGTTVTLTATPAPYSVFAGWSGGCTGTGTCVVTLPVATAINAKFDKIPVALSVSVTGPGSIKSTPAGISCGSACAAGFPMDTLVTLTAWPNNNAVFQGWGGAGCSGTGSCTVTMDAAKSVSGSFKKKGK